MNDAKDVQLPTQVTLTLDLEEVSADRFNRITVSNDGEACELRLAVVSDETEEAIQEVWMALNAREARALARMLDAWAETQAG